MKSFNQTFLTIVVVLSLCSTIAFGQTIDHYEEKRNYITWVYPTIDTTIIKGYLYEIGKDYVIISHGKLPQTESNFQINFKDIEKIKLRKEGRILFGAIIGGITGVVAGILIDDSSNQSSYSGPDTISFGFDFGPIVPIFGATAGALFGGIIGAITISKPINGNPHYQKEKLMKYKLTY